jgi:hypothetical protein
VNVYKPPSRTLSTTPGSGAISAWPACRTASGRYRLSAAVKRASQSEPDRANPKPWDGDTPTSRGHGCEEHPARSLERSCSRIPTSTSNAALTQTLILCLSRAAYDAVHNLRCPRSRPCCDRPRFHKGRSFRLSTAATK